jgi:hypothetical protein
MRQQRHTTAYARSWQPSGNRAAPHRHSSEINASHKKTPGNVSGAEFFLPSTADARQGRMPLRGRRRRQNNQIRASVLSRSREKTRHPAGRAPSLTLPPPRASISRRASHGRRCAVETDGPRQGCRTRSAAPSVCSTGTRHVLLLTTENLLFPATPGASRPGMAAKPARGRSCAHSCRKNVVGY